MKPLITILWIQLLCGFVGLYVSFAGLHTGAMSVGSSSRLQGEFTRLQSSPEFRVPPDVAGTSYQEMLDSLQSYAKARAHNAGYCFLLSGGVSVFAAVMLWFAYRARRRLEHGAHTQTPA